MPNKKISEFPVTTTLAGSDIFLINHLNTTSTISFSSLSAEITTDIYTNLNKLSSGIISINNSISALTGTTNEDETKPTNEVGFIKKLAKMQPSRYNCAGITTTNRVIVWGFANGTESDNGGKLAKGFAANNRVSPNQYIRVPFQVDWGINTGGSGIDYLDENPTIKIEDLYWNAYGALALLSDGTCWVAGFNDGYLGVGNAGSTAAFKPTCGFVKLNFGGVSIKKIKSASDYNTQTTIFAALDTNDSLWLWGSTADGVFGNSDTLFNDKVSIPTKLTTKNIVDWSPTKTTSTTVNFENNILDFSINGIDSGATSFCIITKDNRLYIGGDNTNGQRGTGNKLASGLFNQAKKNSTTYVTDAVSLVEGMYSGRLFHLYINTAGSIFGAGNNQSYSLGNNTTTESLYFISCANLPAGTVAEKLYTNSYYHPYCFALCRDTTTNIKTAYSWGRNGATYGYCGVDSNDEYIKVPRQIQFRSAGRITRPLTNISEIFISDQGGSENDGSRGCVAIVDNNGYVYLNGYKTYNDPPEFSSRNAQIFIKLPLKNIKQVILGGNGASHEWSIFLLKNGTVWGIGDAAAYLFGVGTDVIKHPCRLL